MRRRDSKIKSFSTRYIDIEVDVDIDIDVDVIESLK